MASPALLLGLLFSCLFLVHLQNPEDSPKCDQLKIMIVTYQRSGSTLLMRLLSSVLPSTFVNEPMGTSEDRLTDSEAHAAFPYLARILNCSADYGVDRSSRVIRGSPCASSKLLVTKFVSLSVKQVTALLQALNQSVRRCTHVIFLMRDPRGIYNSRKHMPYFRLSPCNHESGCLDPKAICQHMENDLSSLPELQLSETNRVHAIRYEDLAMAPERTTRRLLQQMSLPYTESVNEFIESNMLSGCEQESASMFSVKKNSMTVSRQVEVGVEHQ